MSKTLVALRDDIRTRLNDTNPGDFCFSNDRVDRVVETQLQSIGQDLYGSQVWALSAVTLVVGTTDYTLPAAEYDAFIVIKRHSDGYLLAKTTAVDIYRMRQGAGSGGGKPSAYAILEGDLGARTLLLDIAPLEADSIDILRSVEDADLTPTDADVIDLTRSGLRALELYSAAELLGTATDEQLTKLVIDRGVARMWGALASKLVKGEVERQAIDRVAANGMAGVSDVWQS